jgi:hypothetical protein
MCNLHGDIYDIYDHIKYIYVTYVTHIRLFRMGVFEIKRITAEGTANLTVQQISVATV